VTSNTNLERDEIIESIDTESADGVVDTNRKRHLRKDPNPRAPFPLHQSMFRSNGDHGIVTQVSCNTCAPFFSPFFHSSETIQSIFLLLP
jgi:hypothetical protein